MYANGLNLALSAAFNKWYLKYYSKFTKRILDEDVKEYSDKLYVEAGYIYLYLYAALIYQLQTCNVFQVSDIEFKKYINYTRIKNCLACNSISLKELIAEPAINPGGVDYDAIDETLNVEESEEPPQITYDIKQLMSNPDYYFLFL